MKKYGYMVYLWLKDVSFDNKLPQDDQVLEKLRALLTEEFGGISELFKPMQYCDGKNIHTYRDTKGYLCVADFLIDGHLYDGLKQEYKNKLYDLDEQMPTIPSTMCCPICGRKDEK